MIEAQLELPINIKNHNDLETNTWLNNTLLNCQKVWVFQDNIDDWDWRTFAFAFYDTKTESINCPFEINAIYYDYLIGDYSGQGIMVLDTSKGWIVSGMEHCSCYGPTENFKETFQKGDIQYYSTIWQILKDKTAGVAHELDSIISWLINTKRISDPLMETIP